MSYGDVKLLQNNLYFEDKDGIWKPFVVRVPGGGGKKSSGASFIPAFGYAYFANTSGQELVTDWIFDGFYDYGNGNNLPMVLENNLNITLDAPNSNGFRFALAGKYRVDYLVKVSSAYNLPGGTVPAPVRAGVSVNDNDNVILSTTHLKNPIITSDGESQIPVWQDVVGSFILDVPMPNSLVALKILTAIYGQAQNYNITIGKNDTNVYWSLTINKVN